MTMTPVTPFSIAVPQQDIEELRRRLRTARWAPDFGNEDGRYGVRRSWLQELVDYWAEDFDWRVQEVAMNAWPHYKVEIDSIPIHFLHARSSRPDAIPLICTHGWPWTFWDWHAVIEPLVNPPDGEPAFHVIVPSLPGYGFSTPLRTTGVDVLRVAELWDVLMRDALGYPRYAAAGGSWGATVAAELAHRHSDHVIGCWLSGPNIPGVGTSLAEQGRLDVLYAPEFNAEEALLGDRHNTVRPFLESHVTVHKTEPQTLAYALEDSPLGAAAWLWSRRNELTLTNGDPRNVWDSDFLCATASIYWHTQTVGTSLRLYYESLKHEILPLHHRERVIDVPTGIGVFPHDVFHLPRTFLERKVNLVQWAGVQPAGGHFAPSEVPDLVVSDIRALFQTLVA